MSYKLAAAFAALVALAAPGVAQADTVTDWNQTMIAGLEAAHTTPQPSARIAAIVQASVFDALNGIERRYTPYHVDANAPRGASRAAAVASAAYTALVALIPSEKPLFDQQILAACVGERSLEDRGERHPRLARDRRHQRRSASVRHRDRTG